jgi:hypothetical protein
MKINLAVEPNALWNPDFVFVLLQACADLSLDVTVKKLCLHEAGHLIYFERICKRFRLPEPAFVGPTIYYNGMRGKFEATLASVKTPFAEYGLQYTDETLGHLARGAVAGGVFLRELENFILGGDKDDSDTFAVYFTMAREKGYAPIRTPEQMLSKARNEVQEELKDETFKQRVRKIAADLESDYFSFQKGT